MKDNKIDYILGDEKITIHEVPVLKCSSCGHITMNINKAGHLYNILDRLWGRPKTLTLHRTLSSDDKSLILRTPKDIASALKRESTSLLTGDAGTLIDILQKR